MSLHTKSAIYIETKIEEALLRHHLHGYRFDIDVMIFAVRCKNLNLDSIDNLLEYTCKRIVHTSIEKGQLQQAKDQCREYNLDFHEMRLKGRDMRKVDV